MVSVCIATYNGEKYVKQQLNSILNQLSLEDEVIVSDDNSTDSTVHVIENYNDSRIKIYTNMGMGGVISNFENALVHATGDYIFLSDQDDIWLDNKVEESILALQKVDLVFSNAKIINHDIEVTGILYYESNNTGFFRNILKNRYIGATIAFRYSLLKLALPFPRQIPMHDQWLGLLAEYSGTTAFIEEPLILYRRHDSNVSSTGSQSQYGIIKKIQFRINILTALLKRVL